MSIAGPVALDVRMWEHPGIGRYLRELTFAMLRQPQAREMDLRIIGPESARERLKWSGQFKHQRFTRVDSPIYSLAEQWTVPRAAKGARLLHVPHFNIPLLWKGKLVVTIHDLIYVREASASRSPWAPRYTAYMLKTIARRAQAVLTVSEHTRMDLLQFCPEMDASRVHVTHEAASPAFKVLTDSGRMMALKERFRLIKPFVLFVGTLRPHKNVERLIAAMADARARGKFEHELILVGRRGPSAEAVLELSKKHRFARYLGEVSDDELAVLYNLTELFVLPSLSEGFGLPLVEAMACGAPVCASDRTSLPEVIGSAGPLFDPERIDALSEVLYNVLKDSHLREKMSAQSLQRAKHFTWDRTAQATLSVYKRVLG